MTVDVDFYVALSAILFSIGAAGVLLRRNALVVLLSIEIMLNAGNLALVAFSRTHGLQDGQIFVVCGDRTAEVHPHRLYPAT